MSREQKLALILGFLAVLVVAMLISDHYSKANSDRLAADVADSPQMIDPAMPSPYSGSLASNTPGPNTQNTFAPLPPTVEPNGNIAGDGIFARAINESDNAQNALPNGGQMAPVTPDAGYPEPVRLTQGGTNTDPDASPDRSFIRQLRQQGEGIVDGISGLPAAVNPATVPADPHREQVNEAELRRQLEQAAKANQPGNASPNAPATTPQTPVAERWHIVANNDSLYALSTKYYGSGKYWKKLAEANKSRIGSDNSLRPGVRILIPDAAALGIANAPVQPVKPEANKTKPETTKADATKPETKPTPAASGRIYEVKKGDTLGEISMRELGTSKRANEIIALNGLKDANSIRVGQKLKLPAK